MTDREKLVGIMGELPTVFCNYCGEDRLQDKMLWLADHLLANGVTVQPPKKAKKQTDLTGKCGSCAYAVPREAFGGSACYVLCVHPERRHVKSIELPRQRTCKACKLYMPKPKFKKEAAHDLH